MSFYDDAKYGVIERQWFGLTTKHGGQANAPITFNETAAYKVTRWYPKGPIKIKKFGLRVLATMGKGEQEFKLMKNGTSIGKVIASTTGAPYSQLTNAMNTSFTVSTVPDGDYLGVYASTNVCSTGSVAFFIDYTRMFDAAGTTWEV
jgi:hypothetical protein